ncbi:HTH_Tnp_Tc3_2 domain-containing protein [Trichonephila clavipes]|nr:HTH_Tnp_Tc3_2 domain-containing protein [Trichonephila clavipes]
MDITPRKHYKIISLNEYTFMTIRDTATAVGVNKSSASLILRTFQDSGTSSPKTEGKCDRKRKTNSRTDKILIRNSTINPRKTSIDLRKDFLDYGAEVSISNVRKNLLEVGRKATS